jgi:hypothetical protein
MWKFQPNVSIIVIVVTDIYVLTYLLTHSLTHSMVQDIILKAECQSDCQKISCFLMDPEVHYRVHKSTPLDPMLSQPNPVRPVDPYLPNVHLNAILPSTPRSSQWSLTSGRMMQKIISVSGFGLSFC